MTTVATEELWTRSLQAPPGSVVSLAPATPGPEHLDFLGLVQARRRAEPVPDAVLMRDGQPLVYLWDTRLSPALDEATLTDALRRLALRSDAPFAALVRPGAVQVFALAHLDDGRPLFEEPALQPGLLARLAVGDVPVHVDGVGAHELMLDLLKSATADLMRSRGIAPPIALALMGRALFIRFLADRGILPREHPMTGVDAIANCFASPAAAAATCRWLDDTFNGDLLALPEHGAVSWFEMLDGDVERSPLTDLTAIVRGDKPVGDGAYQTRFNWGDLHFAYLPVGLLSQVYEEYAHLFDAGAAKDDSVYYTPRHIAEYVVDHALGMLGDQAYRARVLDPAAGGCVFLLTAFRRLVQLRWSHSGVPPTTATIRAILNQQLVGIDKNPAARQLSALALYLTALELDPNAARLENLRFDALQGQVLLAAEDWVDRDSGLQLGSLAQPGLDALRGQFDVVVGNPPWTSRKNVAFAKAVDAIARSAMVERGVEPAANPDGVPDLPFLWQATRWARPGGVIALALHARLLIKSTPAGWNARKAVFRGLDVQYIVNGQELRKTHVWPNMQATFCLLFALNRLPQPDSRFFAVTPHHDVGLNRYGRVRIDSKDSWASEPDMVLTSPFLFKTLAKGNALDVELIERISGTGLEYTPPNAVRPKPPRAHPRVALETYVRSLSLVHGQGYKTSGQEIDAQALIGRPMLPVTRDATWSVIPVERLPRFAHARVHRIRDLRLYRAPLVLVRKSPSSDPACPLAMLAFDDVVFNESYIGYSFADHPDGARHAVYLWALLNSRLFLYYVLMTSSTFGVEREAAQKSDFDTFPVMPFAALDDVRRDQLGTWAVELRAGADGALEALHPWVEDLYGLKPADRVLISDRLAYAAPFSATKRAARRPPSDVMVHDFCAHLQKLLAPFDLSGLSKTVLAQRKTPLAPWRFVRIDEQSASAPLDGAHLAAAMAIGDAMDSSLVEYRHGRGLYLGLLNQARYWTRSAARSIALGLVKRDDPILRPTP